MFVRIRESVEEKLEENEGREGRRETWKWEKGDVEKGANTLSQDRVSFENVKAPPVCRGRAGRRCPAASAAVRLPGRW